MKYEDMRREIRTAKSTSESDHKVLGLVTWLILGAAVLLAVAAFLELVLDKDTNPTLSQPDRLHRSLPGGLPAGP